MKEIEELFPKAFLARQGSSWTALQARLQLVGEDFVATLGAVDEAAFYASATGKWTPAQVADHVVQANRLFGYALAGLSKGRDVFVMPRGRLTEDGRAVAPEEPAPDRSRADLVQAFETGLTRLLAAGEDAAAARLLGDVCLDQAFFGPMTGLECLQLAAWHTRHHAKQLPGPAA